MNRLQKKCFVASAGVHLLLPVILVLGSALTPKSTSEDNAPLLEFLPLETTDLHASGGGNPNVRTAPAQLNQPLTPAPKLADPAPPKPVETAAPPEPQESAKTQEESFEPRKETPKKRLPNVPTMVTTRKNSNAPKTVAKKNGEDTAAREANEMRKRLATEIGSAANDLRENSSTTIKFSNNEFTGPGGGGVPYANFLDAVRTIYTRAWNVPDGVEDDEATTEASVTIARNGDVVKYLIVGKSGNAVVDHSVQLTLLRVKRVAPLPSTAKEEERTVTIGFNVKAKRGTR